MAITSGKTPISSESGKAGVHPSGSDSQSSLPHDGHEPVAPRARSISSTDFPSMTSLTRPDQRWDAAAFPDSIFIEACTAFVSSRI